MRSLAIALIAIIASLAIDSVVVSYMWNWYMVPLGIHPIGLGQAAGLSLLGSLLSHRAASPKNDEQGLVEMTLKLNFASLFILFLGWIVYLISFG